MVGCEDWINRVLGIRIFYKMREITITSLGNEQYEVTSKKKNKIDKYNVDLRTHYCDCKGWFYSSFPKTCIHIESIIQILRAGGHCVRWNKREQAHYDLGLKCQN